MSTARVARKVVVIAAGWAVLALGVALLASPVPASLIVALGLAILATEYRWAHRTLRWIPVLKDRVRALASRARQATARVAR